ncbi:MAG: hypothetical protein H0T88_00960 [Lysobacter sp.]|nr:hypothetical protein [Lysobacter sp.]
MPAIPDRRLLTLAMAATLATIATVASPLTPPAHAATAIQRCIAADGTPIYTDKPCRRLNAQRAPLSAELLSRIAREQASSGADAGDIRSNVPTPVSTVSRRSAASGCARTATQMTMDLQGSWALGDVNRVAESYHWVGMGNTRAQQIMNQLDRLASQELIKADYFDASIGSGAMQLANASGSAAPAGILQLTLSQGATYSVQDFDVEHYRGCYFIRF